MCEPTTIALAGAAIAGGVIKGAAARSAAYANANILNANAATAEVAAGDAVQRGDVAEGRARLQGGELQSRQKQEVAAGGVDVQSGSAADVQATTATMTEYEANVIKNNAMRESLGFETQAKQFRRQAQMQEDSGDYALAGGLLSGVSGGGQIAATPILRAH